MSHQRESESDIVQCCRKRQKRENAACGVVLDLYHFNDDANIGVKSGKHYQATHESRISFDPKQGIVMKGSNQGFEAKFWTHELGMRGDLEAVIRRSFTLKHEAILRPLLCAESVNPSRMVTACLWYDDTLVEWLSRQHAEWRDYLSDDEKNMVISLVTAIKEMWEKNCTSDTMDQIQNYVMVGQRIKILPFSIRRKGPADVETHLRNGLANFLEQHIAPVWNNDEFFSFIELLRNNDASYEDILGHPVLLRPAARQAMYRENCPSRMEEAQRDLLNLRVNVDTIWAQLPRSDAVLEKILRKTNISAEDAVGALRLARVVSCHYTQNYREAHSDWAFTFDEKTG